MKPLTPQAHETYEEWPDVITLEPEPVKTESPEEWPKWSKWSLPHYAAAFCLLVTGFNWWLFFFSNRGTWVNAFAGVTVGGCTCYNLWQWATHMPFQTRCRLMPVVALLNWRTNIELLPRIQLARNEQKDAESGMRLITSGLTVQWFIFSFQLILYRVFAK